MARENAFSRAAWKRLKKNKGALFGLAVIMLSVIVAVFAYFIAPDPSPFANRIILEIGGQRPGYEQSFLLVKKEKEVQPAGWGQRLIAGREDAFYYVPITGFEQTRDSIIVQKYIDEGVTDRMAYAGSQTAPEPVVQRKFLLGTDKYGRDIFSRILVGTRVSLSVGLITVIISLAIGLLLGSLAGYYRGRTDRCHGGGGV